MLIITLLIVSILIVLILIFVAQVTYISPGEIVDTIDCFDTILFRYHGSPEEFYTFLEKEWKIPGFREARSKSVFPAYSKSMTDGGSILERIYQEMGPTFGWSEDDLKRYAEMEREYDDKYLFVIYKNVKHMKREVTTVVSDTFYSHAEVKRMLESRMIPHKDVVVSGYKKHTVSVWKSDKLKLAKTHLGDNIWSDVIGPAFSGIKGIHMGVSKRTYMEELLENNGYTMMSNWMRFLRLSQNPYHPGTDKEGKYELWNEQIEYNIPLMIWSCLKINNLCQNRGIKRICFATRDTCHMRPFFDRFYMGGGYKTFTFHTSRIMLQNPTDDYIRYARACLFPYKKYNDKNDIGCGDDEGGNSTLFVDLNGTGRSIHQFLKKHIFPDDEKQQQGKVHTFFSVWHSGSNYLTKQSVIPDGFLFRLDVSLSRVWECFVYAAKIEMLNYDTKGMLVGWDPPTAQNIGEDLERFGTPIREEPKYDVGLIEIYHQAIHTAMQYLFFPEENISETLIPNDKDTVVSEIIKRYSRFGRLPQIVSHDEGLVEFFKRARKMMVTQ